MNAATPARASSLGVLLEQRGDLAGAEAAYRRADERGDAVGAFNLAAMLAERNDTAEAEAGLPPRRRARPPIGAPRTSA